MPELYTIKEAAAMLRVCESTMRAIVKKRKIRFIRLKNAQGSYRFTQAAIDEFLRAGEVCPVGGRVDAVEAARASVRRIARELGI